MWHCVSQFYLSKISTSSHSFTTGRAAYRPPVPAPVPVVPVPPCAAPSRSRTPLLLTRHTQRTCSLHCTCSACSVASNELAEARQERQTETQHAHRPSHTTTVDTHEACQTRGEMDHGRTLTRGHLSRDTHAIRPHQRASGNGWVVTARLTPDSTAHEPHAHRHRHTHTHAKQEITPTTERKEGRDHARAPATVGHGTITGPEGAGRAPYPQARRAAAPRPRPPCRGAERTA